MNASLIDFAALTFEAGLFGGCEHRRDVGLTDAAPTISIIAWPVKRKRFSGRTTLWILLHCVEMELAFETELTLKSGNETIFVLRKRE